MGRRSIKCQKNIYQTAREAAGLTREAASERLTYLSSSRIEKIESEKTPPHPEEVVAMAQQYGNPLLCNYFCTHECAIGKKDVPELQMKELPQIALEIMTALNKLANAQDRLVEIAVDGAVSEEEEGDFQRIRRTLNELSVTVKSLQLWFENRSIVP